MQIAGLDKISIQALFQNKRVTILVALILFLLLFFGIQKFWMGGVKPKSVTTANVDTNGEIQEVVKRTSFLVNAGKFEQAIVILNEALIKYPNQQDILLQLGIAHRKAKSYLQAEQVYQQALKLNPACIECMNNLAVTVLMNGHVDRSIALLGEVNKKKPDYPEGHFNLAVAYEKSGQLKNAVQSYQRYLQLVASNDSRQEPAMARERVRRLQEGM